MEKTSTATNCSPLISVIIPVYNVELYIDRCLESVANQTYTNLEIILVNDGSQDKSGEKCDEWAQKDHRIKVIHQENAGQSVARNRALEIATGEFIGFCDSDDWFSLDAFEKLMQYVDDNVGVVSGVFHQVVDGKERIWTENWETKQKRVISGKESFELMYNGKINHILQTKLFRKSVIEGIRFPKDRLCEDQWFSIVASMSLWAQNLSLVEIPNVVYYYRYNGNGTTANFSPKMAHDFVFNRIDTINYITKTKTLKIKEILQNIDINDFINISFPLWDECADFTVDILKQTSYKDYTFYRFKTICKYFLIKYCSCLAPLFTTFYKK